jgi:hypothetical protein
MSHPILTEDNIGKLCTTNSNDFPERHVQSIIDAVEIVTSHGTP